jgi:NDP-sugar pyrophosphorylase family protein
MLRIIIPLAGSSELFVNAGYYYPKPLIELNGAPMIEKVLQNPAVIQQKLSFIFIIKEEEANKFHLDSTLKILIPDAIIIKLKNETKGGLCSVLMAIDDINGDDELLILNGDQIIDASLNDIYNNWKSQNADAGLVIFKSVHPRWAYARMEDGVVVQTAEKNPISNHALCGVYYFKQASEFFEAAFECIKGDVHLDGMFFISPTINQFVLKNKKVIADIIESSQYHLFYAPQILQEYERNHFK